MIDEILKYNKEFVENKQYEAYVSSKYPSKKIAIVSCMDTRLTELLPAALGLKNGDVKLIKNAGAIISSPFGSVMRSLVIAIYELNVDHILVIGHHDCGMQSLNSDRIKKKMKDRGIADETFKFIKYCGIDFDSWLCGFSCPEESVKNTVDTIENHPLMPKDIKVYGLVIDPTTGRLECVSKE